MHSDTDLELFREVFDTIPSMVFVLDEDVRIQEYNAAAADLLGPDRGEILKHRGGEVLHCLHSQDVPEGCGRAPFCKSCVVRNSVREAFSGKKVVRSRSKMELLSGKGKLEIYALITASPFVFNGASLVLMVIEDITQIAELQRMIPICASCKRVRDDRDYWMQVEAYFKRTWDLNFTHGICPECLQKELAKLDEVTDLSEKSSEWK